MANRSSDPIFATETEPSSPDGTIFRPRNILSPIICDTNRDYSSPGGRQSLSTWLEGKENFKNTNLLELLVGTASTPSILKASYGLAAILAHQSADRGIQYKPDNISTYKELSRLSKTGMVMLTSFPQLSVTGYWNVVNGVIDFIGDESSPESICKNVIRESPDVTTFPVLPYALFIIFSILILVVSYSGQFSLLKQKLPSSLGHYSDLWNLHTPGKLHKRVTESLRGRDFDSSSLDTTGRWPDFYYSRTGTTICLRFDSITCS